ncbi:MAG: hybrid sensor histidine kinase/response regulator [Rickettsiales bacterium]|nr:hybrid sensor histidine kinase/response regulator [Rickettsiales bacterium]
MKLSALSFEDYFEHAPIPTATLGEDFYLHRGNAAFHALTRNQLAQDAPLLMTTLLDAEDQQAFARYIEEQRANSTPEPVELTLNLPQSDPIIVLCYATHLCENADEKCFLLHLIDQTEQKHLEMRFAHSQKMQAVGQLAGGVAHDFNNLLTAMIGFCDLLLMRHPAGDPSFADIMQIKQNANRAANLVRQLLAFSRRQTLQPVIIDLTDVLAELSNLIRRLIGENIELEMLHGRDLGQVKADQGQLEQVIINLAVNARDAMKEGGKLRIESRNITIDKAGLPEPGMVSPSDDDDIQPGDYVLVEIEDTGTGIDEETLKHIFEPFFSTKEIGSGTGLGLATVYGIVKQTGGYVYVRTEVGKGTTFCLYFTRHEAKKVEEVATEDHRATDLTGGETILLVEDETPVRIFAARALRNKGYEILEADSGEHALDVFRDYLGEIDLIVSDVMMPGINGPTMYKQLKTEEAERMAGVKVIFISGYAEDAFTESFGEDEHFNFLPKPFTLKQLAAKVKEVISE